MKDKSKYFKSIYDQARSDEIVEVEYKILEYIDMLIDQEIDELAIYEGSGADKIVYAIIGAVMAARIERIEDDEFKEDLCKFQLVEMDRLIEDDRSCEEQMEEDMEDDFVKFKVNMLSDMIKKEVEIALKKGRE